MGTMRFLLPKGAPASTARELERTCLAGGPDNMPWPTELRLSPTQLVVSRSVDESGYLLAPWSMAGAGCLMGATATLMERAAPYRLLTELARGKVNQVRCQSFDWNAGGLPLSDELQRHIDAATDAFGKAVISPADDAGTLAQEALDLGYRAADGLVRAYVDQVFTIRHQRQPRLDTPLACRLGTAAPEGAAADAFAGAFNAVQLPLSWNQIEAEEASYQWGPSDALLDWAESRGLPVTAGPLIDFSSVMLPAWLWLWERDLPNLAGFMCKFVEAAVHRYRGRVRRWQLAAASNSASVLALTEEELLGLTYRLAEAARQVDPGLELSVGLAQPWGEYMAAADRSHSPFVFADTLIRSGLNVAALDVELVMGPDPRGSYCRDLLEASRLLDLYALLGVPLRVTLGYPAAEGADHDADPEMTVGGGRWRDGYTPAVQAAWAEAFAALALCKPFVQGVQWCQFSDAEPHQFPHCGLLDAKGKTRPALEKLRDLRDRHLK
jgi:hypothetical protein